MKPVVVQHSFGDPNSGGPITALGRVLDSPLADRYTFVRMHQPPGAAPLDLGLLRTWVSLLRRTRPDIVHVRGLGNEGFRAALAARLAGCPRIVLSIHGTVRDLTVTPSLRTRILVRLLEPATLRMATHIVTVCESAARRDFLVRFRRKLAGVVPNGVTMPTSATDARSSTREHIDVSPDAFVGVVVGRLSFEKGHLVLADALRRHPAVASALTLLIIGDGPDHATISDAYARVPDLDVRFLGRRADVAALLTAADLFLFPTLHENLSNALLEAMASGLPVVASAVGGNVEVLRRGGGLLVPAADPEALGHAIAQMIDDPAARARHGRDARQTVESAYTVDHMIAALDRLYTTVLEGTTR